MSETASLLVGLVVPALFFLFGFWSLAAGSLAVKALEDHARSRHSWGVATLPGVHVFENAPGGGARACRYCGQTYSGDTCPKCGGPR